MLHHPTLADSLIDPARIDHPPRRDHGYLDVLGALDTDHELHHTKPPYVMQGTSNPVLRKWKH